MTGGLGVRGQDQPGVDRVHQPAGGGQGERRHQVNCFRSRDDID